MMRKHPRVLLVEDSPADVAMVEAAFEAALINPSMVVASDGEKAYELLSGPNRREFDLVILDVNLPRKNGMEVLTELRAQPETRNLPVVMLTTSHSPDDVEQAYRLGANAFVNKPLGVEETLEAIGAIGRFWLDVAILPDHIRTFS